MVDALEELIKEAKECRKSAKLCKLVAEKSKVHQQLFDSYLYSWKNQMSVVEKTKVKVEKKHDHLCKEYDQLCKSNGIAARKLNCMTLKLRELIHEQEVFM